MVGGRASSRSQISAASSGGARGSSSATSPPLSTQVEVTISGQPASGRQSGYPSRQIQRPSATSRISWAMTDNVTVSLTVLQQGREAYAERAWTQAYESLARADELEPLAGEDLELLATAAYMLGREGDWMGILERACKRYSQAGQRRRAARCAFWIGTQLALHGEMGPAT